MPSTTTTTTTERVDQLELAHNRLLRAIEALVTGQDWKAMLQVSRRFRTYSVGNVLLITTQRPDATRVAGYGAWKQLGRQVRRGEKGIAILAPMMIGATKNTNDEASPGPEHVTNPAGEHSPGPEHRRMLGGFRVAHVFDVAQTDGAPLPDILPEPLAGEAPHLLIEWMEEWLKATGWNLLRADCRPANGKTHFLSRTVVVRDDLAPAQVAKTLAHELAHTHLHGGNDAEQTCRGIIEVEAESVAYLLCSSFGLSTDVYTFPYVARWANGDLELVKKTATRVVGAASELLSRLTTIAGLERELTAEQEAAEMTA